MDTNKITQDVLDYYKSLPEHLALQDFDKWEDKPLADFINAAKGAEYYEVCKAIYTIQKKRAEKNKNSN